MLQALEGFLQSHSDLLEAAGLLQPEIMVKTRLMALLALGSESRQVSFSDVQVGYSLQHLQSQPGVL